VSSPITGDPSGVAMGRVDPSSGNPVPAVVPAPMAGDPGVARAGGDNHHIISG